MWKRRASYDPMKAALEGKKRQEEAKRQLMAAQQQQQSKLPERCAVFDMCLDINPENANRFATTVVPSGVGGEGGGGGGRNGEGGGINGSTGRRTAVTLVQLV